MSRSSRVAGFSLIEMLVVVACLGMIFWISAQLLFPMRTASERQRLQVEARQTARAAADYMAYVLRGATDGNPGSTARHNPLAVMSWVVAGTGGGGLTVPACPGDTTCRQLSYNNVTLASGFGDEGTDIITVGQLDEPIVMRNSRWPGFASGSASAWFYEQGCTAYTPPALPDDVLDASNNPTNTPLFAATTGQGSDPAHSDWSKLMVAYDENGAWGFYRITDYQDTVNSDSCKNPDPVVCELSGEVRPCFQVIANPGSTHALSAPGGASTLCAGCVRFLTTGARFMSYRVCNGWLQQKTGLFAPGTDNNCQPGGNGTTAGWTSLLPNVEDMQIAYVFSNGDILNTPQRQLAAQSTVGGCTTTAGVPCQGLHTVGAAVYDATNVIAFRVTIVARSEGELIGAEPAGQPLSAEDHILPSPTTRDRIRRHIVSANALVRNRVPST